MVGRLLIYPIEKRNNSEGNKIMDLQDYMLVGFSVTIFIGVFILALIAAVTVVIS